MIKKHGSTSNIERFTIKNSSTGVGLTGLTEASTGLIISTICNNEATATTYTQAGSTIETIAALGTYSAPTATKCRFKEVDATNHKGLYELQFADTRYAIASAKQLVISVTGAASVLDCDYEIELVSFDPHDAVRMGMTSLPNAVVDGAGGLPVSDAGELDLDLKLANTNEITVARMGVLTDWINDGRLDLLLDAIPTTAMRGTDNAALASGVDLTSIHGVALTETVNGYLAAAFVKLFDVVTPVLTAESVNQSANNNTILAHGTYGSSALQILVAALQTDLDNGTDGLGALKTLVDAVPTVNEIQAGIEENGASVIDTIRDYIENVTYGLSALKTLIDAVNTDLSNGTDGLGALKALIDTNKSELDGLQGTDGKCLISTDVQNLIASLIVDAEDSVCDALLTGASHNIVTSLGRRVREVGAYSIESGTAQAGTSMSITLAATANGTNGIFNRNLIVLIDNTGKGQTRTVVDYNSTSKVCVLDREWRVTPDATTTYQIVPSDTPLIVDHGLVQAATVNTITLRDYASAVNNNYLCNIITIIAGTGRGQARLIGAYNGATKVATICGDNWVTTPDATSVYVMMPYGASCTSCLSSDALALINTEIDNALNTAIPGSPTAGSINEKIKALPSGIAKNVVLSNLDIYMLLEDGITAATGKTVTGQIRKDAGSFIGLTNAITEVSGGLYTVADGITQAEMNADKVTLKFTATDCRDTIMMIYPT